MNRQEQIFAIAYRLHEEGREEESVLLYSFGEAEWDDAIHIASPWNGHMSLCGNKGRNLVPLDGERPGGVEGCWTCLQQVERLVRAGSVGRTHTGDAA